MRHPICLQVANQCSTSTTLRLAATPKCRWHNYSFKGHSDWANSGVVSLDSQYIVSESGDFNSLFYDETVRLYNIPERKLVHKFERENGWFLKLLSPQTVDIFVRKIFW